MSRSPLVSVIILNYKRREAFVRSLASVRRQSYANREIIVVDNNSQEDLRGFLREQAPEVRLFELLENRGAAGGRNAGILAARGEIVITLDNDVLFYGSEEIRETVETFARRRDVHVLAYKLCDDQTGALRVREWCHPRSWTQYAETAFETNYFVEGACAARREVYQTVGLYYEPLFIYCEGWDLALRIIDHGFRIYYEPNIRVCHLMSSETRQLDRTYYLFTRNYIWIAYKDYQVIPGLTFLTWKLAMMFYFAIRCWRLKAYMLGIKDGVVGLASIRRQRTPIQTATIRRLRALNRWRPTLWARFRRHREFVQL